MIDLRVGCDPETFLSVNGEFISAHGLFPGTKNEPFKVDKGAVQVDGLALEFNIDPAKTAEEFDANIETVLKQMKEMVSKVDKDMKLNFVPVARFNKKYFEELPIDAKVLGCDPDFASINGQVIVKSVDITDMPLRTAAGHVHLGWTEGEDAMSGIHFEDARFVANYFYNDFYKSPFCRKTPEEYERIKYYGYAGAFRPKSYGVELRQYSNVWVEHPETRKKMFDYVASETTKLYKG
jgi:hypothetical protein